LFSSEPPTYLPQKTTLGTLRNGDRLAMVETAYFCFSTVV